MGEDVAWWEAGFQGKAGGLWPPAAGIAATDWDARQGHVPSESRVLCVRLRGDAVPLCKEDMG